MWTLRPDLRLAIDDGISHCRGDQVSAHPCVVLVEIDHFRGVRNAAVEAEWIAVLRQVLIERITGGPTELVTVEHTERSVAAVVLVGGPPPDLPAGPTGGAPDNSAPGTRADR